MKEKATLRGYGKYGGNPIMDLLLERIAKRPVYSEGRSNLISPEYGALLAGEDWGIPETTDAQHIPFQAILASHPTMSIQSALKLAGTYIYPERANEFGTPINYLQAHEDSHLMDKIPNLKMRYQGPSEGIGNKGFMPVKRTRGSDFPTSPAQIEDWLLAYPPANRPEERKAHLRGMEALQWGKR